MLNTIEAVRAALGEAETGWTMGSFGAIAEFHHVAGDPPASTADDGFSRLTARGGIKLSALQGVRPVAYETLSANPNRWAHAVALCLPADRAGMNRRSRLTELGPDRGALRADDRGSILFDMGLDQPQIDFCLRTSDPDLLTTLRSSEGRSLFDPGNPAMRAILSAHPHRIAQTRLGRVEVFQMIGGPDTGGVTPAGPHTHVLPKLLRTGRTHSANTPIPAGWVPCASFHPANPVSGPLGEDQAFDADAFTAFQRLLEVWGIRAYVEAKQAAWAALRTETAPVHHREPESRLGRTGLRTAIRQWRRQHGDTANLRSWAQAFDRELNQAVRAE